jgi:hypothetical protein
MTARSVLLAVCFAFWFAPAAHAQLVGFDFTGKPGDETSAAATVTGPNLQTTPSISRGSTGTATALVPTTLTNSINSQGFPNNGSTFDANNGAYYTFTLTPTTGNALQINDVNVIATIGASGPKNVRLYGIDTTTNSVLFNIDWASNNNITNTAHTFTVNSTAPTNDSVEVRIYGYNTNNFSQGNSFALVSPTSGSFGVSVNAVPEAETYVLAGLGLGLVGVVYARQGWNRRRLANSAMT